MFRMIVMGVVVPAVTLTSVLIGLGGVPMPVITTPEPASLLLLATGVAGIAAVLRF